MRRFCEYAAIRRSGEAARNVRTSPLLRIKVLRASAPLRRIAANLRNMRKTQFIEYLYFAKILRIRSEAPQRRSYPNCLEFNILECLYFAKILRMSSAAPQNINNPVPLCLPFIQLCVHIFVRSFVGLSVGASVRYRGDLRGFRRGDIGAM